MPGLWDTSKVGLFEQIATWAEEALRCLTHRVLKLGLGSCMALKTHGATTSAVEFKMIS